MKHLFMTLSVFVLVLAATGLASAQSDPRIGTWKLNVAKSTFDPAAVRKSETRTYAASGGTITMQTEVVSGDGSKRAFGYTAKSDGKDYPYTGQKPADTISVRRSGNTFITESKNGGKLLFTTTDTLSADGRVLTLTTKGVNADGQSVNSVRLYEKQ